MAKKKRSDLDELEMALNKEAAKILKRILG